MARFDVYQIEDGGLVVDCQAELLDHLKTRFVVPILPHSKVSKPIKRLNPSVSIGAAHYYFCADMASTVRVSQLKSKMCSLADERDQLSAAIDMLLIGF